MHFILPKNTLVNLDFLREKYQNEKKINLDEPPSRIGRPIFFGGTDVVTRKKQIQFLEKIQVILRPNLFKEEEIKTAEEWEANLTASRVMIAACLYVQSKIIRSKRNSTLYRLLEDDLGITTDNFLDNEDRSICFLAAKRIIMSSLSAFEDANIALKKAKKEPFSESDWDDFKTFLIDVHISKIKDNPYLNYPVTSITQPLFGAVFAYTGASLGVLAGNSVSNSTKVLASKYQLTAYVGSTLLVFGSAGPAGVALFAPVIAERLINAFCSISMAHILGMSMGIIGQGVGIGIGIPLDLAYQLLRKTCTSLSG
ncbi:MAG: type IV secretion protein Dot, partial [bacterium]|nr:type IV secretion protein Dot [bacterium]